MNRMRNYQRLEWEQETLIDNIRTDRHLSVKEFCKMTNIGITDYQMMLTGERRIVLKSGKFCKDFTRIIERFEIQPEDILPREICLMAAGNLLYEQAIEILHPEQKDEKDMEKVVSAALETLTPREEQVLRLKFFDDKTYREIGMMLGRSGQRVQKIIEKGISKLRHPRHKDLRSLLPG